MVRPRGVSLLRTNQMFLNALLQFNSVLASHSEIFGVEMLRVEE